MSLPTILIAHASQTQIFFKYPPMPVRDRYQSIIFVCLVFIVPLENLSLIWRRHNYRRRTANFDLCSTLWSLSSEGYLLWVCLWLFMKLDDYHPFIIVISEDPWHSHLLPSVWKRSCLYLFYDLGLTQLGFEHPTCRLRGQRSNPLRHRRGNNSKYKIQTLTTHHR